MTNGDVARLRIVALVVPVALGLACGLKRDWSICAPKDKQPCLPGYVCTDDLRCVRATDGGATDSGPAATGGSRDGAEAVESAGDTSANVGGPDAAGGAANVDASAPAQADASLGILADAPLGVPPDSPLVAQVDAALVAQTDAAPVASLDALLAVQPDAAPVIPADAAIVDVPPDAPAHDTAPSLPTVDAPATCTADRDCSLNAPLCLSNRCAKCTSDNDCAGRPGVPACAASGLCVACTQNRHCTAGTAGLCDTTANQCVGCLQRSDCASACQVCLGGVCAAAPLGTVCRPATNSCDQPETCTGNSPDCPSDGFKDSSTICAPAACSGNQYAPPAHCAGTSATCPPAAQPTNCNAYACTLTGCKTSCAGSADCASPSVCNPDLNACGGPYYTAVAAGSQHTCAIVSDSTTRCWGRNDSGELGMGQVASQSSPPDPTVFRVENLTNAVLIGANQYRSCAVLSDQSASCWGWNYDMVLGDSSSGMRPRPGPVPSLTGVTGISLGGLHACVVTADLSNASTVSCWGANDSGQTGTDPAVAQITDAPHAIAGYTNVLQVSAGGSHTCMVLKTGQVYCWGANDLGQLGDQTTDGRYAPGAAYGITDAASVAAGSDVTCARSKTGAVQCWGNLPGFSSVVTSPTIVAGLANATALSAGFMVCGLMSNGTVWCWEPSTSTPTQVIGISDAKTVAVGGGHACVLTRDGSVKCWGNNLYGQLGDETTNDSDAPVTVKGP